MISSETNKKCFIEKFNVRQQDLAIRLPVWHEIWFRHFLTSICWVFLREIYLNQILWQTGGLIARSYFLMPILSASSNIFWPCSKKFDHRQYFLNVFKYFWPCSTMQIYNLTFDNRQNDLTAFKRYWTWSKFFELS